MNVEQVLESADTPAKAQVDYSIRISNASKLNLADFQNSVPLLRELTVLNDSDRELSHLQVRLESYPPFLKPKTWSIDACDPNSRYGIKDCDVSLDGVLLGKLTEAETSTMTFSVVEKAGTADERVLTTEERKVELLPRNQWGGLSHLPDLVAAFVQPNELAIDRLLKQTAQVLRDAGKSPALNGYQGGAKRAWELASALWTAVAGLGLDYALPPASFEHRGQKVRSTSQVLDARIGTCLDLTLLFCSALEQAGLNPIVVFTKGHAFAGVWLRQEEFSTVVVDDVTAIRKRVRLKELVLFETTLITQRPCPTFTYATELAASAISEEKEEEFELVVDIRRARMQRIKPLASGNSQVLTPPSDDAIQGTAATFDDGAPDLPDDDSLVTNLPALDPKDRLARWQRKLLDLSLRNNLVNFKAGKKSVRLDAPEPGALEDMLSDGAPIRLLPRPDLMDGRDPRNQAIHEQRSREDVRREHALDALKRREVFVSVDETELETRLIDLYRNARTTLQEGGANTLFLALGFLNWTRVDKAGQKYKAPLILIPVSLHRKSARSDFTVCLHEDEPRFNPTLIEMLRQDFNLNLGIVDGDLPHDDAGLDIARIWKIVSHAVRDIKGWEVSDEVVLASFSFAKYLMWVDLAQRTDQLRQSAVVRHLIDTPREPYPSTVAFPIAKQLDVDFGPETTFCPLPADSSQLSAVMAGAKGKDFVLIGPPGTGKSQTIANLIAQCLAEGKRVLFVSEKIAALDVVYRRLREVGLGEFCLELHSSKARKLDVITQLQKAWDAQGDVDPNEWRAQAVKLKRYRDDLNQYVERLHHRHPNGLTIYKAIGNVVDGTDVPVLELSWTDANAHDLAQLDLLRDVAERLEVNAEAVGTDELLKGPLMAVGRADWTPTWQQAFVSAARSVVPAAEDVQRAISAFQDVTGLFGLPTNRRSRAAVADLSRSLPDAFGHQWGFVFRRNVRDLLGRLREGMQLVLQHREVTAQIRPAWPESVVARCKKALALLAERERVHAELGTPWSADAVAELEKGLRLLDDLAASEDNLSVRYGEQVEQINVHQLHRGWAEAERSVWPMSWLRKRQITRTLQDCVTGTGDADIAKDLPALVRIRDLKSELAGVEIGPVVEGIWAGLKTRQEFVRTALRFQESLAQARQRADWADQEFEPIENGRCGAALAAELNRLRMLRGLDADIIGMQALADDTGGLWTGHATRPHLLAAAMRFAVALRDVQDAGALQGEHDEVASSECGGALAADYQRLRQRAVVEEKLRGFDELGSLTGGIWAGLQTSEAAIDRVTSFQARVSAAIANLAESPEDTAALRHAFEQLVVDGNALLDPCGPFVDTAKQYLSALEVLPPALAHLSTSGTFSDGVALHFNDLPLDDLITCCKQIVSAEPRLKAWCAWRKVRDEALALSLAPVVHAMESGAIRASGVLRAFETNYSRWWLNRAVDNEPVIRCFVSAEHEKRIGDFRALDKQFTDVTRAWVRTSLCAGMPKADTVTRTSEWGVLRHEINKKKQHMPLRELMKNIPTALAKLTPCLLMSPLSIAQYLAADASTFDLVVFDEASQIPVWDAIGAMARGKQVVMVGDPKQLPPTAFFDRAESSEDDEDVEGDLESILDECMGANLPTMNLAWHYRSRNESLIAFSNHRYYGGGLVTFPSPVTEDRAVSFHHVAGVYEKGGARINKVEAKALVADIVAKLKSPGFKDSKLTIGVVTFNTEQMNLIEDLLDDERRKDPSLEPYFSEMELEPLFVKNLESVQGDERDIIYFSITYGPDLAGAVSMNFGPMNRDGGERRLNVAITRARHELRVFSSLKAEQFDLSRTQAAGVRDLKHFLEFAERGPRALAEATKGSLGGFESPFEEAVASALASKGWQVQTQIGASSFRVDLGVVHPDAPGTYLCGVECDGATYHRSATARDRDMLREQVLRGLGWEIVRIWSTDWWVDRAGTLEKVHASLDRLLEVSRQQRSMAKEREAAEVEAREAIAKARTEAGSPLEMAAPVDTASREGDAVHDGVDSSNGVAALRQPELELCPGPFEVNADAFFDASYDVQLRAMVEQIVGRDGPIRDTVLARKIARVHGWQRTGARIQERVSAIAFSCLKHTEEDVGVFFWANDRGLEAAIVFSGDSEAGRNVDEICMAELVSLAKLVVAEGKGGDGAVVAMAKRLGMHHVRAASRGRFESALETAQQDFQGLRSV
jgi:very-short-patch-repair endonuclease